MTTTIVRYKTKADRSSENQALIEAVFAELETTGPEGLRYASYRLDDGVSFVHVAATSTDDGTNPLTAVAAFTEFLREIGDRCAEAPVAMGATLVGSYGLATSEPL